MQTILLNPRQVFQKLTVSNYWSRLFLNGAATMFLDDDQINLLKIMIVMILPVVTIYAKVKVSELSAFVQQAATTISSGSLCHQRGCS